MLQPYPPFHVHKPICSVRRRRRRGRGGGVGSLSDEFKDTPFKEMTKCWLHFKLCMILVLSEQRLMDKSLKNGQMA